MAGTRALLGVVSALVLAAAGCGGGELPSPGGEEELLRYSRGGGFAPSIYELEVDAAGRAVVRYGDTPETLKEDVVQLSATELAGLRGVLEENPISDFPEPDPDAICADCFSYELVYGGDSYAFDDATPSSTGVDAVRGAIEALPLPEDNPMGYA
jgi:hypothetical protein